MDISAAQALTRFGLGRRPADPLPTDPRGWLQLQLQGPDPMANTGPSSAEGLTALRADRKDKPEPGQSQARALFRDGVEAQLANALTTQMPFRERLVWFWTNHFTVSVRRGECAAVLPSFVNEAIRPHVTGKFADMVLAVMHHPAMLMYLDNQGSVGPDSPAGQRSHRGLNENLARECMELHTVTPVSGYTQADVTAFADILTGWSIDMQGDPPGFVYRPGAHQPGTQTVMGHEFPEGEAGGIAALKFLANHHATYRSLATQLTQCFVADDPPPDAVNKIENVLRNTNGDLGAAASAVVQLDAAWTPQTKLRTPQELVIATLRALDLQPSQVPNMQGMMAGLGQPMWGAPQPNGWPDRASAWAAPEAMMRRVDWAYGMSARVPATADELQLADSTLGPFLQQATQDAMKHAGSRRDALTLLLTSPEFQRR
jgi:uncharacterized protein (DUF1800 family)